MHKSVLLSLALLPALLAGPPLLAAQEMDASITRDETGEFACTLRKRVAVLVNAPKDLLPEPSYQYAMGGNLHVVCADFAGTPPAVGKKVRIAFHGDTVRLLR